MSDYSPELIELLEHCRKMLSLHSVLSGRENDSVRCRIQRMRDGDRQYGVRTEKGAQR